MPRRSTPGSRGESTDGSIPLFAPAPRLAPVVISVEVSSSSHHQHFHRRRALRWYIIFVPCSPLISKAPTYSNKHTRTYTRRPALRNEEIPPRDRTSHPRPFQATPQTPLRIQQHQRGCSKTSRSDLRRRRRRRRRHTKMKGPKKAPKNLKDKPPGKSPGDRTAGSVHRFCPR